MALRISLVLALSCALLVGLAAAQEEQLPVPPAEQLIAAARAALAAGNPDDAALLLEGVKAGDGDVDDLDFLYGSIALQRDDWPAAIARFRAMLARNPDLPRVRLDLALAYFRAGRDRRAAYHFRLALGDKDLPPAARANALAFLDRIRRRKAWSVSGSLSLAPDTNINAATSAREVPLFGLPATLSDDARRTSGVGLNVGVRGGYEWRLSESLKFGTAVSLHTKTYEADEYNQQFLNLQAGPRLLFRKFDLRPELAARARWIGSDTYSRALGLQLSSNWLISPTWRLSVAIGAERITYETFLGDGDMYFGQLGVAHALGRATVLRADTVFRQEALERDAYSWREYVVGVSATRELPWGFVVSGGPSYGRRKYDAPLQVFGPNAREDDTLTGWLRLSNRYIEWRGFMPEITIRYEHRDSNLSLYDYSRTAGEFGVVASF